MWLCLTLTIFRQVYAMSTQLYHWLIVCYLLFDWYWLDSAYLHSSAAYSGRHRLVKYCSVCLDVPMYVHIAVFCFSDRYTPWYLVHYVNGWMYFVSCMFGIDFVNLHHWMEVRIVVMLLTYSCYPSYFCYVYAPIYDINFWGFFQFENTICKSICIYNFFFFH